MLCQGSPEKEVIIEKPIQPNGTVQYDLWENQEATNLQVDQFYYLKQLDVSANQRVYFNVYDSDVCLEFAQEI